MKHNWKEDPRLKQMNKDKISFLQEFAKRVETSPKNQLMSAFLNLNMEANSKGIQFNDKETDLLVSILTADMSAADRQKLDTLKMLSKKLGKQK